MSKKGPTQCAEVGSQRGSNLVLHRLSAFPDLSQAGLPQISETLLFKDLTLF